MYWPHALGARQNWPAQHTAHRCVNLLTWHSLGFVYKFAIFADTNISSDQQQTLNGALRGTTRERDRELLSMQLVMQQMKLDNEHMRKQLVDSKVNTENYR